MSTHLAPDYGRNLSFSLVIFVSNEVLQMSLSSLSQKSQCQLSWVCKAAVLNPCQFSENLRPFPDIRIVSVYGEECMSIQMVRRWRSWFLEGRQRVYDDERSGRPVTATDNAAAAVVRNVVEADRRVTIDEIIIRLPPGIEIRRSSIGTIMSDV
ncbi:hypothetical protein LAZ67_2000559 [Cordylochernes scorpioides]|uniref:Uncharacterized protein n=1 Tax=Cordylochernes scorpioides TaxID=51811 RepID=A0ABY6K3R9_9ARAC|nr:hypothetical protein LAZ67_2000559 [Cordylochernes scorpioides]